MEIVVSHSGPLRGSIRPPSDKSLTHRAFMFAAAAQSPSAILNPLMGEDCVSTLRCLEQLGALPERVGNGFKIAPAPEWLQPEHELDCGNSGTTMRLLSGFLASRPLHVRLIGDASLSRRPMRRIADPLRLMGAKIEGDTPPLTLQGGRLRAIDYASPVASAQIKSCILLAGLRAEGTTWVSEPAPSRDHTERMLRALGVQLHDRCDGGVGVDGGTKWDGFEFNVPADISSAAFWAVAAALLPGSEIELRQVGTNPSRTGLLDVLTQAGVPWAATNERDELGEPIADLRLSCPATLRPFEIFGDLVPRLIDEIPVLAVLATQCHGTTTIQDAAELKVKESDRILTVANGLRAMGAKVEPTDDGMIITGPTPLYGATIDALGDHRIGMAFAIAGLIARGDTIIQGADAIATSYPGFWSDLETLQG